MKKTTLAILACPVCRESLELKTIQERDGDVVTGTLTCRKCGHAYPIKSGIPNLMPPEATAGTPPGSSATPRPLPKPV